MQTSDSVIFALYSNCIAVKGAKRSLLCDLQTNRYRLISNGLYNILTVMKGWTVEAVLQQYPDRVEVIRSSFSQLQREEYGTFSEDLSRFPDMDFSWDSPGRITNAIVDVDESSDHSFANIFEQLDRLNCEAVQLRCFAPLSLDRTESIVAAAERRALRSLDLVLHYTEELTPEALEQVAMRHQVIASILVHSAPESSIVNVDDKHAILISFYAGRVTSPDSCGIVDSAYFSPQLPHVCEAMAHNSCLNRKVSICADGEIRNCPSMAQGFGNAGLVKIADAIAKDNFTKFWSITKDQIEVCRDCEFRYICTDCRAHLSDPGNPFSKPAKCSYDPYTATWGDRAPKRDVVRESVPATAPELADAVYA